ncbi:hypothetical protein Phi13:2_gp070 [Cellulophaga phage phi13:2]|uniref:Uncharacterized protein n=4 Tax=Pachyviridae TaxID=2946166 RepID=R9ZZR2_9CAUD|nr:hypothetical protein Phi19:3_gp069 [Cellulophaga phage phi19:3]YP_008241105.1 hypothetical protein Phi46:3_gp062 [Cellulophaga phage phi46:3]YP_008241262.1 hypothetical protein Phi18:3_gp069 [Cellulophaga phage phi18:3]YP_008242095.1 hypothetical protein Phi13:2_gp070 [Cellulophaga phage phi13:2]AGO47473.1 hypothetical protein Phi19:3_gp069 [Cellulophaga phage phi19:3]AGO48581.1 hypothetical protein Phi18:3_gp069 [Cellulophaga phage phi18:3]AGO48806.1 hypothetical protein Phi46:3_gp062 [Ce
MDGRKLLAEIDAYASKCWRRINTHYGYFTYSFSSYRHKVMIDDLKMKELINDCEEGKISYQDIVFFIKIVTMLKFSREFHEAAVVRITKEDMKGFCNNNSYKSSKEKLIEYKLLIPTISRNHFIINPRYINKFYKTKVDMSPEDFKEYKEKRLNKE